MSQYRNTVADETVVVVSSVRTDVRRIKVIQHTNDAPVLYLQLFNDATPTLGTTAPNKVIEIPAGVVNQPARLVEEYNSNFGGLQFATALAIAVTTTHDGLTAPDAGDEPEVVIDYHEMA